ncbi:MAG: hypothetical protein ACJAYB_000533 [Psychromonas sp.]|jgi:hypothetical protein
MNIDTLNLYKNISESMTDVVISGNDVSGMVEFNKELISNLRKLEAVELSSATFDVYNGGVYADALTVSDDLKPKHFEAYDKAKIEISKQSRQHPEYFICEDWNDLLAYPTYLLSPVTAVYLSKRNEIVSLDKPNQSFQAYLAISRICDLIDKVSHTKIADDYIILCGQPLKINFKLNEDALSSDINTQFLDELLERDQHKEAMYSLIRESLYSFLSGLDKNTRFQHLLTHFNAFASKLLVSYEQFVRNYSFDKVRREYQEKTTEYIGKINKTYDDVAAKTLSIPLGVWFAVSQIQTGDIDSFEFLKNIVYCFMILFLVIVVCFSLWGQFSLLGSTKNEYKELFTRLKSELDNDQEKELDTLEKKLDNRNTIVWNKLASTIIFAIFMLSVTVFVTYQAVGSTIP